jgi:hypothetical protein
VKTFSRTYYFLMLFGVRRVGRCYASRKTAKEWVSFVAKACRADPRQIEIHPFTLRVADGALTPKCAKELDEKFNMNPPTPETLQRFIGTVTKH